MFYFIDVCWVLYNYSKTYDKGGKMTNLMLATYRPQFAGVSFGAIDSRSRTARMVSMRSTAKTQRSAVLDSKGFFFKIAIIFAVLMAIQIGRVNVQQYQLDQAIAHHPYGTVLVQSGDTLSDLASKHQLPGFSQGETITYIMKINRLKSVEIMPGQVLKVPL